MMLRRLRDDERGMALIIALLITFVIVLLSITVVDISIHNVQQSAYDRKRVQSVNASEAGVDYVWNRLEQTAPDALPWNSTTKTSTFTPSTPLGTGPGQASFSSTVQYFDANQTAITTQPSQSNVPAYALITSYGTTNGTVTRKVQSYVKLTPIRQAIQSAVLINSGATFSNNFTINGDQGNDGDIHIESGDLTVQNQPDIYGSVYVSNGSLTIKNNNTIHGNAWAWSTVDLQQATSTILGTAQSSNADIKGSGTIGGDATAGTSIAAGLKVSGSKYANSPTTTHPPAVSFPLVCWDTTGSCSGVGTLYANQDYKNNATGAGTATSPQPDGVKDWTIVTFTDCTTAKAALLATHFLVDTVVRITAVCDLQINNNDSVNFDRDLVIFTNGSITLNQQNNWNGTSNHTLGFIVNYQSGMPGSCSSSYNITTSNYSNFNNVYASFYSPCTINIQNLNAFSGQILGGDVNLAGNFTLNYKPVLLPGLGKIVGFQQDVVYEREVA
jgi:Tfp pilus assembly protein PilX